MTRHTRTENVYVCKDCGVAIVSDLEVKACAACGGGTEIAGWIETVEEEQ